MKIDETIDQVCVPVCEAVLNLNCLAQAMLESHEIIHQGIQPNANETLTSTIYPSVVSDRSYSTNTTTSDLYNSMCRCSNIIRKIENRLWVKQNVECIG